MAEFLDFVGWFAAKYPDITALMLFILVLWAASDIRDYLRNG